MAMKNNLTFATPCPHKFRDPLDKKIRTCKGSPSLSFHPLGLPHVSRMDLVLHCDRCGHREHYQVELSEFAIIPKTLLTAVTTENLNFVSSGEKSDVNKN